MLDGLPKDLREMDEEQFVEVFNLLRERTKDWTEFKPEFITEDSRHLFVLRCALGLTQKKFGTIIGVTKSHIRRIEAGERKIIHSKPAERWSTKIKGILIESKPSINIAIAKFIDFKRLSGALKSPKFIKPISKLSEDELLELFIETKKITKDFTEFNPEDLMKFPRLMLILRLLKGLSQPRFADLLVIHRRTLTDVETGRDSIGMNLAIKLSKRLEKIFKESVSLDFETLLWHFKIFTSLSKLDLQKAIDRGLIFAQGQKPSELEEKIKTLLESHKIKFSIHSIVQGLKRKLNVDFAIPSEDSPQFIIEVFSVCRKPLGIVLRKVWEIDHRFHMIKSKEPQVKTIMCVKLEKDIPIQRIRERIELELLCTDVLLIGEEIQKLPEIIKKIISN